jgi:hypothetical protein
MENRIKELKEGLGLDRTSCPRFLANQVRVLLTVAAYLLYQTLQQQAGGTACAGAQVSTLRERLIKLACGSSAPSAGSSCTCLRPFRG